MFNCQNCSDRILSQLSDPNHDCVGQRTATEDSSEKEHQCVFNRTLWAYNGEKSEGPWLV